MAISLVKECWLQARIIKDYLRLLILIKVKYTKTMDDSLGWPETSVPEIVECGEMEFLQKLKKNFYGFQQECV